MMRKAHVVLIAVLSAVLGGLLTLFAVGVLGGKDERGGGESREPLTLVPDSAVEASTALGSGLGIDDPRISLRQLRALAERHAGEDPAAAVKRALSIPGHDNREAYLGEVLRAWGEVDGPAAARFVSENFKGRQLTDNLYYVADGWAERDPEGAAGWFLQNTTGSVLDDALWEALESWGRKDPRAAFAWSANLDEYQKSTAMLGLAEGWGAVDPEGAAAAGMEMRDTDHGREFLISVMTQWAGSGPEAAGEWTAKLEDERLRAALAYELGEIWAHSDPEKAAAWAAGIEDSGSRRVAEVAVATGWSVHDPGGAVEWAIRTVKDQDQLEEMVGDITFQWSNLDPRGATNWLGEQKPGATADLILGAFSSMIFDQDAEAAVAWAKRISDPSKRDGQLRALTDAIVASYGEDAPTLIRELELPETQNPEFTKPAPR